MSKATEETMNAAISESNDRTTASKIGYGILGIIYAIAAYQIPVLIVDAAITSTDVTELIRASILIQFVVGISLSVIAYITVSNRSLKSGMRVLYGMIIGPLFVIGGYTILTSLTGL